LVGLNVNPRDVREEPRGPEDLVRLHTRRDPEQVLAGPDGHHDLFQGGVPRSLPDAVDRAFDLPRAVLDGDQRVGHGVAQIVVAGAGGCRPPGSPAPAPGGGLPAPPPPGASHPPGCRDFGRPGPPPRSPPPRRRTCSRSPIATRPPGRTRRPRNTLERGA